MEIRFDNPLHVYFVGIGGISMSGIAEIILTAGFTVSGSDRVESDLTKGLEKKGAHIFYDQSVSHVEKGMDVLVYSAAVAKSNPDREKASELGITEMSRAEFMGLLMKNYRIPIGISGTHGKTTTTSMVSEIMMAADEDPTIQNGGILRSINSNTRIGGFKYFVFEACEYTNSFHSFFPRISIILNIEEDHLDFFKDLNDIRNSFKKFADLLPEDGLLVINGEIDHFEEIAKDIKCPYLTYGPDDRFDYYPSDITCDEFGHCSYVCNIKDTKESFMVSLSVTGVHNVYNSLAAIAVADFLGLDFDDIQKGLIACEGSKRRFEKRGEFNGVTVIDDYAHHPSEIRTTLAAAQNYPHKKLWCVFQPHTYTRTKAFLDDFAEVLSMADSVILTDVYPAREKDIYGCNSTNLYEKLKEKGTECVLISSFEDIEEFLYKNCINGDLLITVGAGDIVKIADKMVEK